MVARNATIDDATPQFDRCHCGHDPDVTHDGHKTVITCSNCKEKMTVETAPFFRSAAARLEHQTWRAASAWNGMRR